MTLNLTQLVQQDAGLCTNLGGRLSRLLFKTLQQFLAVSDFNLPLLKVNQNH